MVALTLISLYNYLHRSLLLNNSSISSLLLQAQKKLCLFHTIKKEDSPHKLHILYPGRTKISTDNFFHPKIVIKQYNDHATIKKQSQSGPLTPHYVAPRDPIVLCHGLFGFDVRGPSTIPALQFHYWSGVEDTLAKLGAKVIVTRVPEAGSIWERSNTLHNILQSIIPGKHVNFVAHSMGGLDCRHLLANIPDRSYHVESLTTICTPHRGSPIMDWFRDHVGLGRNHHQHADKNASSPWLPASMTTKNNNTMRNDLQNNDLSLPHQSRSMFPSINVSLDKLLVQWLDEPAYAHLTTDFCNDYFNPNTPDDPNIKYYSYGGAAKFPAWSSILGLPWKIVYDKEGDNDGIVSVNSAKWGTYVKTINADHWDLSGKSVVPYRFRTTQSDGQKFNRLDFYAEMATHLYHQGH
ncbi:Alpha/Beta hydrolase protein [Pilobolus umbonatus]|nr:Alpha/Beta hydrolase protein [Pilobolus umbonatus]